MGTATVERNAITTLASRSLVGGSSDRTNRPVGKATCFDDAELLGAKVTAAAAAHARSSCLLIELIGEFDQAEATNFYFDVRDTAHWLSWACSMSPGTAREHVRVSRALPQLPALHALFAAGEMSYSKVREATRLVGRVQDKALATMAKNMTAAQLARSVSAYRSVDGSRLGQEGRRSVAWTVKESGLVRLTGCLPAEEGAVLVAALNTALDRQDVEDRNSARALVEVAQAYLASVPEDVSGEDRTLVVVHVAAAQLTSAQPTAHDAGKSVPAGTSDLTKSVPAGTSHVTQSVPAGTPDQTCHIAGVGSIERTTAQKLACDATVMAASVAPSGEVLALGRTRRLVSKAQRRALMIRDRMCRFPGCSRLRHLHAHHVRPWSSGGPTDLDNLILLCSFHHTCVHEGGVTIEHEPGAPDRWRFRHPDGQHITADPSPIRTDENLLASLDKLASEERRTISGVGSWYDPAAQQIIPGWRGEPFSLHDAVRSLFDWSLPKAA